MKKPAKKRMMRPILRSRVVRTGRMTGAGMAMMHRSVTRFMTSGGTMLRKDCGLQNSVACQHHIHCRELGGDVPPWSGKMIHIRSYGRHGRKRIIMMEMYVTTTRAMVGTINFSTHRPLTMRWYRNSMLNLSSQMKVM